MKILPDRLRYHRLLGGLTQAELANRAGISESYVQQLEKGKFRGKVGTIKRLADALDVDVESIAEFDELVG